MFDILTALDPQGGVLVYDGDSIIICSVVLALAKLLVCWIDMLGKEDLLEHV